MVGFHPSGRDASTSDPYALCAGVSQHEPSLGKEARRFSPIIRGAFTLSDLKSTDLADELRHSPIPPSAGIRQVPRYIVHMVPGIHNFALALGIALGRSPTSTDR